MTARPSGAFCSPPSPSANAIGNMPMIMASAVMQTGRRRVKPALSAASMLVLPSLEDNCPMSVLEAMAAGLPVAAANVGGVPDLITHGTDGLLFDPEKEESIRAAIAELLTNGGKAAALSATAKEKALARFHPQKIAARHVEIYRQVIASGPAARASSRPKATS